MLSTTILMYNTLKSIIGGVLNTSDIAIDMKMVIVLYLILTAPVVWFRIWNEDEKEVLIGKLDVNGNRIELITSRKEDNRHVTTVVNIYKQS